MSTKVTVLGAAGGIGQPLSMLLKLSPEIDELACYDIVGTPGVAADLSHVSSSVLLCCLGVDMVQTRATWLVSSYHSYWKDLTDGLLLEDGDVPSCSRK